MKTGTGFLRRAFALLLCFLLLIPSVAIGAAGNDKQNVDVNRSDSLSRLFHVLVCCLGSPIIYVFTGSPGD